MILIVDDRPSIVEVLSLFLQLRSYGTRAAYDGRSALEAVRHEPPDLILLDLVIPEQSGFEVLKTLKGEPGLASIPVIVMTARSEVGDLPTPGLEGAAALLRKPFDLEEVAVLVERTLAGCSARESRAHAGAVAG